MKKKISILALVLASASLVGVFTFLKNVNAVVPAIHTRVSVNNSGDGQGGNSHTPGGFGEATQISANGKYVLFASHSSNLVNNDTNGKFDVFLRDLDSSTTTRVSTSVSNVQANNDSGSGNAEEGNLAISQDGRYIAFSSTASNLIDGATIPGSYMQVYLKDTKTNSMTVVTQKADGTLGNASTAFVNAVSNDGRFVLWKGAKNTNLNSQGSSTGDHLYLADLNDKTFKLLDPKDGVSVSAGSQTAQMSCDGSFIIAASNDQLTADDTDSVMDVYLLDLRNGFKVKNLTAASLSVATDPSISCNGDYVSFTSADLVFDAAIPSSNTITHLYLYDRINEHYSVVDISNTGVLGNGQAFGPAGVDNYGNVVFSSDAGNLSGSIKRQILLKHKEGGLVEVVSQNSYGGPANGNTNNTMRPKVSLSYDGKRAAYAVSNPPSTLFSPSSSLVNQYDSNGYGDVVMSLTGL